MERVRSLGGVDGNEILTSLVAAVLTVLLIAEGITILQLGPLLVPHMAIGLMLIPVLALKLGSTGYRFARYYGKAPAYLEKGPPLLPLRLLAPVLVGATIGVFATGIVLLLDGRKSDTVLLLHKASFVVWGLSSRSTSSPTCPASCAPCATTGPPAAAVWSAAPACAPPWSAPPVAAASSLP